MLKDNEMPDKYLQVAQLYFYEILCCLDYSSGMRTAIKKITVALLQMKKHLQDGSELRFDKCLVKNDTKEEVVKTVVYYINKY